MNYASAQILYLSTQKSSGGLMIGAEVFDIKTKTAIKPFGYNYEWTLPAISLEPQRITRNILFVPLVNPPFQSLLFDLQINAPLGKKIYLFQNQKLSIEEPKVKIIRKTAEGLFLPLSGKVKKDDFLVFNVKNFSSKNLTYVWEFNGIFVSNNKELFVANLKEKKGVIKIKVFGVDLRERAEDIQKIQIE
jgi:hypothetical protein